MKFAPEGGGALTPMATGESEELTCNEVTRMSGHNVEKSSFGFCVTEGFQGIDVRRFDFHREKNSLANFAFIKHSAPEIGDCAFDLPQGTRRAWAPMAGFYL